MRATHRPRFDREPGYVPYFWWAAEQGRAPAYRGDVLAFEVSEDDRRVFPELRGVDVVAIQVCEGQVREARVTWSRT